MTADLPDRAADRERDDREPPDSADPTVVENRRLREAVGRVRALVAVYASDPYCWTKGDDIAASIRDALDGGDS